MSNFPQQLENAPYPDMTGLEISLGPLVNTFFINDGFCRDSTNTYDMYLNTITLVNVTINGVLNSLDKGTLAANSDYYMYLVANSTGNPAYPTGLLLSRSATGPLMLGGYNIFRLIGSKASNGSGNVIASYNVGNAHLKINVINNEDATETRLLTNGNSTTYTVAPVAASPFFPIQFDSPNGSLAVLLYKFIPQTGGNTFSIVSDNVVQSIPAKFTGPVAAQAAYGQCIVPVYFSRQIRYKVTQAGDSLTLDVSNTIDLL